MREKDKKMKLHKQYDKKTVGHTQHDKRTNRADMPDEIDLKYDNFNILWVFDRIDKGGDFAFNVNREDFQADEILSKIIDYSSMTWAEIKKHTHDNGKSKHHLVKDLKKLSKKCIERIEKLHLEQEIEGLFSFALNNKTRIWGLRKKEKFHILWYDPKHEIYPSKKKYT